MDKNYLLGLLPPFNNKTVLIEKKQTVRHIITEVLASHELFAKDYDQIALQFYCGSPRQIAKALFDFCKANIRYRIEPEERQTTKSPAAIIALGDSVGGDCKHYASFIGGVLDALKRRGCPVDWCYRFASYDMFDRTPQHVFVVVFEGGQEIWVDPVLSSFDQRLQPYHKPIDKCPKSSTMPLFRISGTNNVGYYAPLDLQPAFQGYSLPTTDSQAAAVPSLVETAIQQQEAAEELSPELQAAINLLLQYKVLNDQGQVSDQVLSSLQKTLQTADFEQLALARQTLQIALNQGQVINGAGPGDIFATIWRGIKKATLSVPRNAYLSLVALNAFGYATKLYNAIYKQDGTFFQPNQDKLYQLWHSFGGDWANLRAAISSGHKKKAILGCSPSQLQGISGTVGNPAVVVPAWVTAASAIIAAVTPLISALLRDKQAAGQLDPAIDPNSGLPIGTPGTTGSSGIMDWISSNPIPSLAIAGGLVYLFYPSKKPR
jgi:hypothetical protein